jgi:type I restriction enzyme S subunit
VDDGVKFIRVNDLLDLDGRAENLLNIPVSLSEQYPTTIVGEGDLLVSVVGTLGRAALASKLVEGANVNRAIAVLRMSDRDTSELVLSWVQCSLFERQALDVTGNDSAQRTLGMEDLANFSIRLPTDQSERTSLVLALSSVNGNRRRLENLLRVQLAVLRERRQALITGAVTGQIDVTTARGVVES